MIPVLVVEIICSRERFFLRSWILERFFIRRFCLGLAQKIAWAVNLDFLRTHSLALLLVLSILSFSLRPKIRFLGYFITNKQFSNLNLLMCLGGFTRLSAGAGMIPKTSSDP